jgi:hypothetical protein
MRHPKAPALQMPVVIGELAVLYDCRVTIKADSLAILFRQTKLPHKVKERTFPVVLTQKPLFMVAYHVNDFVELVAQRFEDTTPDFDFRRPGRWNLAVKLRERIGVDEIAGDDELVYPHAMRLLNQVVAYFLVVARLLEVTGQRPVTPKSQEFIKVGHRAFGEPNQRAVVSPSLSDLAFTA